MPMNDDQLRINRCLRSDPRRVVGLFWASAKIVHMSGHCGGKSVRQKSLTLFSAHHIMCVSVLLLLLTSLQRA